MINGLKAYYNVKLNNQFARDYFVLEQLKLLKPGSVLLDAGCGSQRYRKECSHIIYKSQDFGQYTVDSKKMLGSEGVGGVDGYKYGQLDYIGDIWSIDERDGFFDAILCTEVFEHIPYPIETVKEFARLLKPGGKLILTAPGNCLRHMDPFFFYSGFTDRFFEKILTEYGLNIEKLESVGDYYSWLAVEMARTARAGSLIAKLMVAPAFVYYYFKKKTELSTSTLCMGYHIVAKRG
jgi:SAM-dependent methyltransferase